MGMGLQHRQRRVRQSHRCSPTFLQVFGVVWSEADSGFARWTVRVGEPHDQYRRATTIKRYDFQQSLFKFYPRYCLPAIHPVVSPQFY
jgi:hypothetical protein